MTILFVILIIIASVVLGLIVLVQNPKGGGLAGTFAGLSNQFMGVKQTTDVLEKGTWIFAAAIALLSLSSAFFVPRTQGDAPAPEAAPLPAGQQPGNNTVPFQANPPASTPNP